MMKRPARLAADIGGTFTDVVLETGERQVSAKVLTTSRAPEQGVIEGTRIVLDKLGVAPAEVGVVVHGTTLATNALIERKGARTAFVTTAGVGDVLDMGFEKRYAHYDLDQDRPPPLVPRERRFEVPERIAADGEVLLDLDERALDEIGARIADSDIEAVAIGFVHAFDHPDHERRARDRLASCLGARTVCLSSAVCPEIREYERFSTTVANAYVRPLIAGYLAKLSHLLEQLGVTAPLYVMMSSGGLTTLDNACHFPVRLVESGPAGGAILAAGVAREMGLDEALSFDMGGTTAKICLIAGGAPDRSRRFEVARVHRDLKGSGLPLRVPVIDMVEIGAGGGSIARVDRLGRITIGPDSAGADPGPACYGRSGDWPTVTDANLVLGRIDPERFAGGDIQLAPARAQAAIQRDIGGPVGMTTTWAAAGMTEIVDENMANAARVHGIERGKVIGRHTMIAFGGAAPLHATRLAQKLGIGRVIVPSGAGVGSAIGFLRAPIAYEVVRSRRMLLSEFDPRAATALIREMTEAAWSAIKRGLDRRAAERSATVDMRYVGQGHELAVTLPTLELAAEHGKVIAERFETRYRDIYGLRLDHVDIEITAWSLTLGAPVKAVSPLAVPEHWREVPASATRPVFDPGSGQQIAFGLHWRPDLHPGDRIEGPAIVAEPQTSTVVPAGWRAWITRSGAIVMDDTAMTDDRETTP